MNLSHLIGEEFYQDFGAGVFPGICCNIFVQIENADLSFLNTLNPNYKVDGYGYFSFIDRLKQKRVLINMGMDGSAAKFSFIPDSLLLNPSKDTSDDVILDGFSYERVKFKDYFNDSLFFLNKKFNVTRIVIKKHIFDIFSNDDIQTFLKSSNVLIEWAE